jgi:hypothetical protein
MEKKLAQHASTSSEPGRCGALPPKARASDWVLPWLEIRVYNRQFRGQTVISPTVTGLGTPNFILIGNFLWDRFVTEDVCPSPLPAGGHFRR